jgi:hypothetical protein
MKISTRERRFLAAGGLAALAYLGIAYGALPLLETQRRVREEIQQRSRAVGRARIVAGEKGRLLQQAEELSSEIGRAE